MILFWVSSCSGSVGRDPGGVGLVGLVRVWRFCCFCFISMFVCLNFSFSIFFLILLHNFTLSYTRTHTHVYMSVCMRKCMYVYAYIRVVRSYQLFLCFTVLLTLFSIFSFLPQLFFHSSRNTRAAAISSPSNKLLTWFRNKYFS